MIEFYQKYHNTKYRKINVLNWNNRTLEHYIINYRTFSQITLYNLQKTLVKKNNKLVFL